MGGKRSFMHWRELPCLFKDWTICLHKAEQNMLTYVHIGDWWIESNHENIETSFILVVHYIPMKICGKFWNVMDFGTCLFTNSCPCCLCDSLQYFSKLSKIWLGFCSWRIWEKSFGLMSKVQHLWKNIHAHLVMSLGFKHALMDMLAMMYAE